MNGKKSINNNQTIFGYNSVENTKILNIQCTEYNIFVLLENGKIISWGKNNATLGRKCFNANVDSYIPKFIQTDKKFVEISCGANFCLARSTNFSVYSWGYNTHGQLGLRGVQTQQGEKYEPSEIELFKSIKIKQIFARGYSSFAISEGGNNLYAWGNNNVGQLGLSSNNDKSKDVNSGKISIPTFVDIKENISNEIYIVQERLGEETYLYILNRPTHKISQAMIYFQNKLLHSKEDMLRKEKQNLEFQENYLKDRVNKLNIIDNNEEAESFIKGILKFKDEYENQLRELENSLNKINVTGLNNDIKALDKNIEFQQEKVENIKKSEQTNLVEKMKKTDINRVINVIDNISSALYKIKDLKIGETDKLNEEKKKLIRDSTIIKNYIDIFNETLNCAKDLSEKKLTKKTFHDLTTLIEILIKKNDNLKKNFLKNYSEICPDSEVLRQPFNLSMEDFLKIEGEIYSLNYNQNKYSTDLIKIFKSNILLGKQNNNLLQKITAFSKIYYSYELETYIKEENADASIYEKIKKIKNHF